MRRNALELNPQVKLLLVGFTAALWVHSAAPTQAHGAKIEVLPQAVEIIATFDTGEPMDNAQVAVYAPDRLDTPWRTGQTDSEGRFSFTPDIGPDIDIAGGLWEVTVRKAGHGQTTSFSLGEDMNSRATTTSTTHSAVQKWLSIAAVIWGFVGTALFFSKKAHKGNDHPKSAGKSTVETAVEPAVKTATEPAVDSAQAVNSRATVVARLSNDRKNDGKATAEDYR